MRATLGALRDVRDTSALTTWVYRVARRICQKRRERASERDVVVDVSDALALAISGLPTQERQVIALCDVAQGRREEVAKILAIPTGALDRRLHRARNAVRYRIRALLED